MEAFARRNVFGSAVAVGGYVGFFTIAIWTGILSMSVVVAMLVFAVDMTYSIQTVDRFDNPKAPYLQINAT